MTGVIYARYSAGPGQTDQSIEGQIADCTAYAEAEGIDIVEIYADRHISGKSVEGRDEFQRMMFDAERGHFDCVIVWKIDRFGRNRQDIAISKMKLKRAGVELRYAKESVPEGPEGIILESVLEGLAEYYSADLRQKVTRGIRESAKKGKYCGASVPIGYKLDENRHVIINEETAPLVQEAFRMHIAGARIEDIVEMFTRAGVKGQRGGKMTKSVVGRMLRNERYVGIWELAGVPLSVPGIISEEIFEEAQNCMKTSRNNAEGKALVNYLLSGKCFCGYCGAKVNAESGTGRHGDVYHYYKCSGRKRGSGCELKPIKQNLLETAVIEATKKDMLTDKTIKKLTKRILEIQEQDDASDYALVLKNQLEDAEKRRKNLLRLVEKAGDMELEGVPERLAEISREIKDLKGEIIKEEMKKPHLTEKVIRLWLETFRDGDADDEDFKKKMVETFISRVELKNDEATIFYNISESRSRKLCSNTARLVDQTVSYSKPIVWKDYIILRIKLTA